MSVVVGQHREAHVVDQQFCQRHFTRGLPENDITWTRRDVQITGADGKVVFEQKDVEAPEFWSDDAVRIVASKYFRGKLDTPERETSVRQLVRRVVNTIADHGLAHGYFQSETTRDIFRDELAFLVYHQRFTFNSPVWFNIGVKGVPQCPSACFILSVDDSMESILNWYREEGLIFKGGSGAGANLSNIRSSKEYLSGGGRASGPVSFMRAADASAGVIKSGGRTRRAAKLVCLDVDHPDILEFVRCKADAEKRARSLIEAGFSADFNEAGGAYDSIPFQNANHSVQVTDAFMESVQMELTYDLHARTSGEVVETVDAKMLLNEMAKAAWECGDPGLQFSTRTNEWNTVPKSGKIRGSNPCAEHVAIDNSSCNLGSLNLLKFRQGANSFDWSAFDRAVEVAITAMDILVDLGEFPTEDITRTTKAHRFLGLGYANLGAYVMVEGWAYDSDSAREFAREVTARMTAVAYRQSTILAEALRPFEAFEKNRREMLDVIEKHVHAAGEGPTTSVSEATADIWDEVCRLGHAVGFRNCQVTLLAPTGTIAFMMDCATTGIEPELALVKTKKLVGGGSMTITNPLVEETLIALGYSDAHQRELIQGHIAKFGGIANPHEIGMDERDLQVFDCALPSHNGRSISPEGHLKMMAAVQPFLSCAISKTVNVPETFTPEEIARLYMDAWKMGLKSITVYRDGCKKSQPLSTVSKAQSLTAIGKVLEPATAPKRRKLPATRDSITHHFDIAGSDGYFTAGLYDDGSLGEIFVKMNKEGSTVSGFINAWAMALSLGLQYGVPLSKFVEKFSHERFEPSGFTEDPDIKTASSVVDYIARWLGHRFGVGGVSSTPSAVPPKAKEHASHSGPACAKCGSIMERAGSCHRCPTCGETSGCG